MEGVYGPERILVLVLVVKKWLVFLPRFWSDILVNKAEPSLKYRKQGRKTGSRFL
jgi:hypothetical protein